MKKAFGDNQRQIAHAMRVTDCAERLLDVSRLEADRLTVIVAAILHDIGRCKKGTTDHEKDGAVVSRNILTNLGFTEEFTDHVSRIVGSHHSAKGIDTPEFRIVWIADRLVNRKRDHRNSEKLNQEFAKESEVLDQKIKSNTMKPKTGQKRPNGKTRSWVSGSARQPLGSSRPFRMRNGSRAS